MKDTYIKLLIGLVLFATLVALTVLQVPHAERLVDLLYVALLGLGITHLGGQPADTTSTPPIDKQAGRATLGMLLALAVGMALLLSGCASFQQAVSGYESAAAVSIDAANDNSVKVWKYGACNTPLAAIARHPQVVPALKALCLPASGEASTTSALLDAIPAAPVGQAAATAK